MNYTPFFRDVFYQSDCDEAVFRFARLLGWEDELKAMVNADAVQNHDE
jgi:hypothetical protein